MSNVRKAASWLGLIGDEDAYQDRRASNEEVTEEVELVEEAEADSELESAPVARRSVAKPLAKPAVITNTDLSRIVTIRPRTYNEAKTIGEHFRDGVPVIINLSDMDESEAKRLIDFSAGLIFGLHGTMERVTNRVFLLSPPSIVIAAEDKERIVDGFYNQS